MHNNALISKPNSEVISVLALFTAYHVQVSESRRGPIRIICIGSHTGPTGGFRAALATTWPSALTSPAAPGAAPRGLPMPAKGASGADSDPSLESCLTGGQQAHLAGRLLSRHMLFQQKQKLLLRQRPPDRHQHLRPTWLTRLSTQEDDGIFVEGHRVLGT